ncbi:hypothetical protein ACWGCW_13630 [Streptomyces sp. NPDC054933]
MNALTYTVHACPTPLWVSTNAGTNRATLRITVSNPGPETVTCDGITVTLPTGAGGDALTATPETITACTDDADWTAGHQGGGVFAVRPTAPGAQINPGARFLITLDGIEVNRTVGTAAMGISEVAGNGRLERGVTKPLLAKAAPNAMLEDFHPDQVDVDNGQCVTLTWKCVEGPEYVLFYDDQSCNVNGYIENGNGSWRSCPLTKATAFMLLASTSQDGAPVTYGLTTAVTVKVPHLEVGNLEVNGTVRLFGQVQEIAGGTESEPTVYTAETDGMLSGYIKTTQDGAPAELKIFVTPEDRPQKKFSTQSWDSRGGTDNQEASLLVPVPKKSTVRVVQKGDAPFTAAVTWFPFGTGPMQELDQ